MATSTGRKPASPQIGTDPLPRRSPLMIAWFRRYVRRYAARRFHALRLARGGFRPGPDSPAGPVVVVMNHPSWWDPLFGVVLADLFGDRVHGMPIDAAALAKYRFFERLGFFGVEQGTARGARELLRRGGALLADPRAVLWLTPQGRFADARERPVTLREGVGHLACRQRHGCVLPLAVEYGFWEESTIEAFARFGPPIVLGDEAAPTNPAGWTARIADALGGAQDALADDVQTRDPSRFETLLAGGAGVGGVYDLWRRLRSAARGERFVAAHSDRADATPSPIRPGPP